MGYRRNIVKVSTTEEAPFGERAAARRCDPVGTSGGTGPGGYAWPRSREGFFTLSREDATEVALRALGKLLGSDLYTTS